MLGLNQLPPGLVFAGDYRIVRPLAAGGMGAVFVAHQLSTGRDRALKVMHGELTGNTDLTRRFVQEARIGAQIASEHVVEVVGAGFDQTIGAAWLAMELLQGEDLADYLKKLGPLSPAATLELFEQLSHALAAAHDKQIVHRDLKPENLFLAQGRRAQGSFTLKILDFGIAKMMNEVRTSRTGAMGTPLWMAPEQAEAGTRIDASTDVWAMGLIAFRALAGRCFWRAASDENPSALMLLKEISMAPIPPASTRARELSGVALPAGFDPWFARCVDRDQSRRFQHAREAQDVLRNVLSAPHAVPQLAHNGMIAARPLTQTPLQQPPPAPSPVHSPAAQSVWQNTAPRTETPVVQVPLRRDARPQPRSHTPWILAVVASLLVLAGIAVGVALLFKRSADRKAQDAKAQEAKAAVARAKETREKIIEPCKKRLEEVLESADPNKYLRTHQLLAQYLLLREREPLGDAWRLEWTVGRYANLFAAVSQATNTVTDNELKQKVKPDIESYFTLLHDGKIDPVPLNDALIERVRTSLQNVPIPDRYYDLLVNSLNDELINESGIPSIDNKVFPPVQLPRIFPNLPLVNKHFKSRKHAKTQSYQEVEGPYTEKGQAAVAKQIEMAEGLLKSEAWVVPLTKDETPAKIPLYVADVKTRYEENYINQWTDFFLDIDISTPQPDQVELALELLSTVSTPEASPHMRLIETLATHTQFRNASPLESKDAIAREANRRFNEKLNAYSVGTIVNVDLKEIAKRTEKIPSRFVSTTKLIEQPRGAAGAANPARLTGNNKIFEYIEIVRSLREKIEEAKAKPRGPKDGPLSLLELNEEFVAAQTRTRKLLADSDETASQLMLRLMLMPIALDKRVLGP